MIRVMPFGLLPVGMFDNPNQLGIIQLGSVQLQMDNGRANQGRLLDLKRFDGIQSRMVVIGPFEQVA